MEKKIFRLPDPVREAIGGLEDVDLFSLSPEQVGGFTEQIDAVTGKSRVEGWKRLEELAASRQVELTFGPYRRGMLVSGVELGADLVVSPNVPGLGWLPQKLARSQDIRFYSQTPGTRESKIALEGVKSILLLAPPTETLTAALAGEDGKTTQRDTEAVFWQTAIPYVEQILGDVEPEGALQALPGVILSIEGTPAGRAAITPFSGKVESIERLGGREHVIMAMAAGAVPVSPYAEGLREVKLAKDRIEQKLRSAGQDPDMDRDFVAMSEAVRNLEGRYHAIQKMPESAYKSLFTYGFNSAVAQMYHAALETQKDALLILRRGMERGQAAANLTRAVQAIEAQQARVREATLSMPPELSADTMGDRARGYKKILPTFTDLGFYEYRPGRSPEQAVVRIEKFPIPAGHAVAVTAGQELEVGAPLSIPQGGETMRATVIAPEERSALMSHMVGKNRVRPVKAQVTLFMQPRPVTNQALVRFLSPMFPVPERRGMDEVIQEVLGEVDFARGIYPEWYLKAQASVRRGLTDNDPVVQREAARRRVMEQKEQFLAPVNSWLEPYAEIFLQQAENAMLTLANKISKEAFGKMYYGAQGTMLPGGKRLPDLVKLAETAPIPKSLLEKAEGDEEKAREMMAPRPAEAPVFYYIVSFLDGKNKVIWEGKAKPVKVSKPEDVESATPFDMSPPFLFADDPDIMEVRMPGRTFNPAARRAIAYYADLAGYLAPSRPGLAQKQAEGLVGLSSQIAAARMAAGETVGSGPSLRVRYGKEVPIGKARLSATGAAASPGGVAKVSERSWLEVKAQTGPGAREQAVGAIELVGEDDSRIGKYLGYVIPYAIAEQQGMDRNIRGAIEWALTQQSQRDGSLVKKEVVVAPEESYADIFGKYYLGPKTKENPMASRLMNNARYRQLASKTGRVFGRNIYANPTLDDDDDQPTEQQKSSGSVDIESLRAALGNVEPEAVAYFDAYIMDPRRAEEDAEEIQEEGTTTRELVSKNLALQFFRKLGFVSPEPAPKAPESASKAPESEPVKPIPTVVRRGKGKKAEELAPEATERPKKKQPVASARKPEASKPKREVGPEEALAKAELKLAQALAKAQGEYAQFYDALRDTRRSNDTVKTLKSSFEDAHRALAIAMSLRNDAFAAVHGQDILIQDLSRKQRQDAELASAPFARGPDGQNEKFSGRSRADLLERMASTLAFDGTPLFSPNKALLDRGLGYLELTSPEEAEILRASTMVRGLDVGRFSVMGPVSIESARLAAMSQGSLQRVRPKSTSTALLQAVGAKGSHNIHPSSYTAPSPVLDRGFDRSIGQEKKAVILWVSPSSDHLIRYTTGPTPKDQYGKLDVAMVGQFEVGPGETWRDMLNSAFRHTVEWFSDLRKGPQRLDQYEVWLGKSGWPYLYRLYSPKDSKELSSVLLYKRMQDSGLTMNATDEELAYRADAATTSGKRNALAWAKIPDAWKGDAKQLPDVVDDARAYQAAIDRTRKTSAVGAAGRFGTDLFRTFERQTFGEKYEAATAAAFITDASNTPVVVVPPGLYDKDGKDAKASGSSENPSELNNILFTAVRDAVQSGAFAVRLVDGNLFDSRKGILLAMVDPDQRKTLSLTATGEPREIAGKSLFPAPLLALIQHAILEAPSRPIEITVVTPDNERSYDDILETLPATMADGGENYAIVQVIHSARTEGNLPKSTANGLEAALRGFAGKIYLADLPREAPPVSRTQAQGDNYFGFNPNLAGEISRAVAGNIGAVAQVQVYTTIKEHVLTLRTLVGEDLTRRVMRELDLADETFRIAVDLDRAQKLALSLNIDPAAVKNILASSKAEDINAAEMVAVLLEASMARASKAMNWKDDFIRRREAYEFEPSTRLKAARKNPMHSNRRRTAIDIASRYQRQQPWMWPTRD